MQAIVYYISYITAIVFFIKSIGSTGWTQTTYGFIVSISCTVVLFFRSIHIEGYLLSKKKRDNFGRREYLLGSSPFHVIITLTSVVLIIANAIFQFVSYPTFFNLLSQIFNLAVCVFVCRKIMRFMKESGRYHDE